MHNSVGLKKNYSLSDNVIISHFAVSGLRGLLREFFACDVDR
jgi:hypothetical protein